MSMKNEYRKYSVVMVLCFIIGGFSLLLYILNLYGMFWRSEFPSPFRLGEFALEFNRSAGRGAMAAPNPIAYLTSPASMMLLLNGVIAIAAGASIWMLTREKEISSTREKLTSVLLLPEERLVIEELKKAKGAITQSQLARNINLSKVKVHRIVGRLAAKGIIKKYKYGLTNKIVLEKDV